MMPETAKPKLNLLKLFKEQYAAPKKPRIVNVGPAHYCVVRGQGAPGSELFQDRVGALYAIAYALKFLSKDRGEDFVVSKLEGLYGVDGQELEQLNDLPKDQWNWRLAIRVPDLVQETDLSLAVEALRKKGKTGDFEVVSLETYEEGDCVQMLHLGPYDSEAQTLTAMREYAASHGLVPHLWHHEIYLSDPRRVAPERLRTILRLPLEPKAA